MSKERNNTREIQKKPSMTLKEKRATMKAKKDGKPAFQPFEKK